VRGKIPKKTQNSPLQIFPAYLSLKKTGNPSLYSLIGETYLCFGYPVAGTHLLGDAVLDPGVDRPAVLHLLLYSVFHLVATPINARLLLLYPAGEVLDLVLRAELPLLLGSIGNDE
jgi:hypothetical protein